MKLFGSSNGARPLYLLQSRIRVKAGFGAFFSTEALRQPADKGWTDTLYHRVVLVADPRISVVPVLERWVKEGKPVEKKDLQSIVKHMMVFRRYSHALEV
ncbi:putative pentatricopeptide repeat-containing protein, mitochondrial [Cocos nucifera]|uniref:Putative pentatricopeptide repeat-containing protein, mitochondrial n=1 Tax=Cocos nucifera TaxID=13894 RepID=A0A8K0N5V3_COCNU|nr:putative pentatricopeptide repeat-containing protein, mitochondrial [Cocos nucifera]